MSKDKLDETRKVQKPPPDDVAAVKKKREWLKWEKGDVPCEICGYLCPLECYDGFPNVHITCTYTEAGRRWLRSRAKRIKEEALAESSLGI